MYPSAEIKYSFNNTDMSVPEYFDTVVVGKKHLRDKAARHNLLAQGKDIVLLLNNGCSFECRYECGDSLFCGSILQQNLKKNSLSYWYALQSFFPFELSKLLQEDAMANGYRFKISNRPLGLNFTKRVLDAYTNFADVQSLVCESVDNYGLFCVMYPLFARRDELIYDEIMYYKRCF